MGSILHQTQLSREVLACLQRGFHHGPPEETEGGSEAHGTCLLEACEGPGVQSQLLQPGEGGAGWGRAAEVYDITVHDPFISKKTESKI